MKQLLFLALLPAIAFSQPRPAEPLPLIADQPSGKISENLTGWSYSLDGQWVSQKMAIPIRTVSTNEDAYKTKWGELGMDNIDELQMFPMLYGKDTLVLLIKVFENGGYKFPAAQKGWSNFSSVYYWVFDHKELRQVSDTDTSKKVLQFPLRDFGFIERMKGKAHEKVKEKLVIKKETERALALHVQETTERDKVRFQIASFSFNLNDVEGVLNDFDPLGTTVYGRPDLLDFIYYETEATAFMDFFKLPAVLVFRK